MSHVASSPATLVLRPAQPGLRPWEAFLVCLLSATVSTSILLENIVETIRLSLANVPMELSLLVVHLCLHILVHPAGIFTDPSWERLATLLPPLVTFTGIVGFSCIRTRQTVAELINWFAFARYAAHYRHSRSRRKQSPTTWIIARSAVVEMVNDERVTPAHLVPSSSSEAHDASGESTKNDLSRGIPVTRVLLSLFGQLAVLVEGPDGQQAAIEIENGARQAMLAYIATKGRTRGVKHSAICADVGSQRTRDMQSWFNKNIERLRDDIKRALTQAGFTPLELVLNQRDHVASWWSLSKLCEVSDISTFERLFHYLQTHLKQEGSDPEKVREAYLHLIQIYAHGYLVNQLHNESLRRWAMDTFTTYNNQYLYLLHLAATYEKGLAKPAQGSERRIHAIYAAELYEHYAWAASHTEKDRTERRGEIALRHCLTMYQQAHEPSLADEVYHRYCTLMKKAVPKWTPQPQTRELWKRIKATTLATETDEVKRKNDTGSP